MKSCQVDDWDLGQMIMIALLMGRKFLMELERTYFHTFPTLFIVFIIVALKTINNYKKAA